MQNYFPQTFRELVGSVSIVVGIIFSFISLLKIIEREHALRIGSIFSLLGLCLFANNAYTYFAAVFIIATAVTQLEFLQTLAAIIRGNKDYFDFMTKYATRSQDEIVKGLEQEVGEIEQAQEHQDLIDDENRDNDSNVNTEYDDSEEAESETQSPNSNTGCEEADKIDQQPKEKQERCIRKQAYEIIYNMNPVQLALIVEESTFKFLEQKYNSIILRNISVKGTDLEFDGLMRKDSALIVFEIKTLRNGILPYRILHKSISKLISGIKNNFHEFVILRFVLVGKFTLSQRQKIEESRRDINNLGIGLEFDFYTFEEIGLTKKIILGINEGNRKFPPYVISKPIFGSEQSIKNTDNPILSPERSK